MDTPQPPGAGEYAAGEMTAAEAAAFEQRLAGDPALQAEVAFWRRLRGGLVAVPSAPPAGLAAAIVRAALAAPASARPAQARASVTRLVPVPTWIAAAAALLIGLALGWGGAVANGHRSTPVAWMEDGSAVLAPHNLISRQVAFLPQAGATPGPWLRPAATDRNDYPWLGVWIKPIEITAPEVGSPTGHLVVMVAQGSPAAAAGLVPGDLLVGVAGCSLCTPLCIAHALEGHRPGETVELVWWRAASGERRRADVVLGALAE